MRYARGCTVNVLITQRYTKYFVDTNFITKIFVDSKIANQDILPKISSEIERLNK